MSKRFVMGGDTHIIDTKTNEEYYAPCETELLDLLNELNDENKKLRQERERWRNLYELKDKEVTARVDGLNKVCEYYTSEVLFKSDVDPNKAVKEVINEILNTEVEM